MIEVTHSADEAKKPYWLNKTSERINPFQSYAHAKYWIFYNIKKVYYPVTDNGSSMRRFSENIETNE